jgi:uncharacterized protein (TIRG00374 family)
LAVLVVAERHVIGASIAKLGHLHAIWVPVAVALELVSMTTFGLMQRRLFRGGNRSMSPWAVMTTAYAGNTISIWVPFVGPQLAAAFSFRRFRQHGIDPSLAGWALVVSAVLSTLAGGFIVVTGAVLSGNHALATVGLVGGILGLLGLVGGTVALRHPGARAILERVLVKLFRWVQAVLHRPPGRPEEFVPATLQRFQSLRLRPLDWCSVMGLAILNWLADACALAACIAAVGVAVPWRGLLLAYGVKFASGGIATVTPGGIGVVEAALTVALVGIGLHRPAALTAVLLYRLISFWMATGIGGAAYFLSRTNVRPARLGAAAVDQSGEDQLPAEGAGWPTTADTGHRRWQTRPCRQRIRRHCRSVRQGWEAGPQREQTVPGDPGEVAK